MGEKRLKAKRSMVKLAIEKFVEGRVVGVGLARLKTRPAIGSVSNPNILYDFIWYRDEDGDREEAKGSRAKT